ncbi:MAG: ABC transporter substrate-binding protein, partial [Pseudomonadales bacterium]
GYYAFLHMAKIYADDEKSPEVQAWWDQYVELYGKEPDVPAMEGFRGADLVVTALEKAGRDLTVNGLVAALEGITSYQDIFGYTVSFSPQKHSGATESSLAQVQNGRWVTLQESVSY